MSAPLPALVGLCPVHVGEFYAPVDPADPDPKCPACDCRLLVYAPRVDQRDVMAAREAWANAAQAVTELHAAIAPSSEHGQRDDPLCPDCGARAAIEVGYCDNCGCGIATSSDPQATEDRP